MTITKFSNLHATGQHEDAAQPDRSSSSRYLVESPRWKQDELATEGHGLQTELEPASLVRPCSADLAPNGLLPVLGASDLIGDQGRCVGLLLRANLNSPFGLVSLRTRRAGKLAARGRVQWPLAAIGAGRKAVRLTTRIAKQAPKGSLTGGTRPDRKETKSSLETRGEKHQFARELSFDMSGTISITSLI